MEIERERERDTEKIDNISTNNKKKIKNKHTRSMLREVDGSGIESIDFAVD